MRIANPSVPDGLHVDDLRLDAARLLIIARTTAAQVTCRTCGHPSSRVHSFYWRTFQDLPSQDRVVTWRVKVRRFRCGHCPGRIFAERMPGVLPRPKRGVVSGWPRRRPTSAWRWVARPVHGCHAGSRCR